MDTETRIDRTLARLTTALAQHAPSRSRVRLAMAIAMTAMTCVRHGQKLRSAPRGVVSLAAAVALSSLSGCAWTLVSAADAVGSLTQAGFSVASQYSSPTYVTGTRAAVHHVCIELNNAVNDENLVPALRVGLSSWGVTSMVYNAGTSPPDCEAKLTYTATMDFGHREYSDGYTRYLSLVDLRLTHGNDIVVAHYQTEGLNLDRFSTTSTKMRSLIHQMIVSPKEQRTTLASSNAPVTVRTTSYAISTDGSSSYATADVMAVPTPAQVNATALQNQINAQQDLQQRLSQDPAQNSRRSSTQDGMPNPFAPTSDENLPSSLATQSTTPGTPWQPKH